MPQFDVENAASYYRTYGDNLIVGPQAPTMGTTSWDRKVLGSSVSGSEEYKATTLSSSYAFQVRNQFFHSGEVRFLRLLSTTQTIKSSIAPDVLSIYAGAYLTIGYEGQVGIVVSMDGVALAGSDGRTVNDLSLMHSFPFEKKYQNAVPFIQADGKQRIRTTYARTFPPDPELFYAFANTVDITSRKQVSIIFTSVPPDGSRRIVTTMIDITGQWHDDSGWRHIGINQSPFEDFSQVSKMLYGINSNLLTESDVIAPMTTTEYVENWKLGSVCDGWRYGLYSGLPAKFSCVFRQNRFGQLRDMLEQRIYTETFNNPNIGGPLTQLNTISGSALTGEPDLWLSSSIYMGSNIPEAYRVNPYGSGIFDTSYRATQPWHDDDPRAKSR